MSIFVTHLQPWSSRCPTISASAPAMAQDTLGAFLHQCGMWVTILPTEHPPTSLNWLRQLAGDIAADAPSMFVPAGRAVAPACLVSFSATMLGRRP